MRSGLPRAALSELHGNMYIEVRASLNHELCTSDEILALAILVFFLQLCTKCRPVSEYVRLFDVTERTALRRHKTGRTCPQCGDGLRDSIIHFGEKGPYHSPYNWRQAVKAAEKADLIVCLGTSLKVIQQLQHSKRVLLLLHALQFHVKFLILCFIYIGSAQILMFVGNAQTCVGETQTHRGQPHVDTKRRRGSIEDQWFV